MFYAVTLSTDFDEPDSYCFSSIDKAMVKLVELVKREITDYPESDQNPNTVITLFRSTVHQYPSIFGGVVEEEHIDEVEGIIFQVSMDA